MSTSLSQVVQEAIRQNLTGVVAGELKDFIESANKKATELDRLNVAYAARGTEIENLQARLSQHDDLTNRSREQDLRERALNQRELELLRREAVMDAKVAQAELSGVKTTLDSFLRNTTVRETVTSNVAKPVAGYPGGNGLSGGPGFLTRDHQPDTTTTTRTAE